MELRQLRYFVAVAEQLNFSRAASQLCITQSTLSQQIQQLEDELGSQLLRRNSHQVTLTQAGECFLLRARQLLVDADLCKSEMREMQSGISGTLRIGITYTASSIVHEPIREMTRRYPQLRIEVIYTNRASVVTMLREQQIDVALTYKLSDQPDIRSQVLITDYPCAVFSPTHVLAQQNLHEISLAELARYPMALPSTNTVVRQVIDRICRKHQVTLCERVTMDDPLLLLDHVRHSQLVTLQTGIAAHLEAGLCCLRITEATDHFEGCAHTLRNGYHKQSVDVFIQLLQDSLTLTRLKFMH